MSPQVIFYLPLCLRTARILNLNKHLQASPSLCRTSKEFRFTTLSPPPHYLHSFFQRSPCLLGCSWGTFSSSLSPTTYFSGCKIFSFGGASHSASTSLDIL
ncbi:unnamed protein product [Arabidopsis lyrata]|nr:unnamed protein product [Arabidopsis lyrata]